MALSLHDGRRWLYFFLKDVNRHLPFCYYAPLFAPNWTSYFGRPDFAAKEQALKSGLDAPSLEVVDHVRRLYHVHAVVSWPVPVYRTKVLWPAACLRQWRWSNFDCNPVHRARPLLRLMRNVQYQWVGDALSNVLDEGFYA